MATVGPLLGSVPEEVGPIRPYAILGGGLIFATVPDPTQVLRAARFEKERAIAAPANIQLNFM